MRVSYSVLVGSIVVSSALTSTLGSAVWNSALAQEVDNTETLPNAQPGECYAKVITPAEFQIRNETIVVQEASERIQTIPAKYETVEQTILVKEASQTLSASDTVFEDSAEQVLVSPAYTFWTATYGNNRLPASGSDLEAIAQSGVDTANVPVGSCFKEYYTPAKYRTTSQDILVREASEKIEIVPAQYESVTERVIVKEASSQVVDVPATYRTVKQKILVEPAKKVWKQGRGLVERIDNTTGEIMCLVEVPARYETITKTVLDKAASSKQIEVPAVFKTVKVNRLVSPAREVRTPVPAEFKTVTSQVRESEAQFYWLASSEKPSDDAQFSGKEVCLSQQKERYAQVATQVISQPAQTSAVDVPAEYAKVRVNRLVSPASEERIPVPEKTKTVSKRIQVAPSRLEWRKVLCETNMSDDLVKRIQRALKKEGFDPGLIDGVVGRDTMRALEAYQKSKDLDRGGLTFETLTSLNVEP